MCLQQNWWSVGMSLELCSSRFAWQGVIVPDSTSVPGAQTSPGQILLGIYKIELLFLALCAWSLG